MKIRKIDSLNKIPLAKGRRSKSFSLRQPGHGAGWDEDTKNKMNFAKPLVQLAIDCKVSNSDITLAAIERRVQSLVEATSIVILYKAVITTTELRKYLAVYNADTGLDEVDARSINNFLWEIRAKERAANSIVWIENNPQLGWPVADLAAALGIDPWHNCGNNRYSWLRPMLTNTLLPPGSYEREPLVAQPGTFKKIESAMETGAITTRPHGSPSWQFGYR